MKAQAFRHITIVLDSDPQDGFFYPILTLMIEFYILNLDDICHFFSKGYEILSKYNKEYGIPGTPFQGLNSMYHNKQLALSEAS